MNHGLVLVLAVFVTVAAVGCTIAPTTTVPNTEPRDTGVIGTAANAMTGSATVTQSSGATAVSVAAADIVGTVYGEGVTLDESVPISQIFDNVDEYLGNRVRVEGIVTGVCEMRGCWIEIASDREFETIRLKVEDGVIVFPVSARGKYAVAEGMVARVGNDPEQVEQHRRMEAAERGETPDPNSTTEPMPIVRIEGTGADIRDRP